MSILILSAGRDNLGAFATDTESAVTATPDEAGGPGPTANSVAVLAALRGTSTRVLGIESAALGRVEGAWAEAAKPEPEREKVEDLAARIAQHAEDAGSAARYQE